MPVGDVTNTNLLSSSTSVKRYVGFNSVTKKSIHVCYNSFKLKSDAEDAVKSRWWETHKEYQKLFASLNNNNANVNNSNISNNNIINS